MILSIAGPQATQARDKGEARAYDLRISMFSRARGAYGNPTVGRGVGGVTGLTTGKM
jgi:hypothetical protein